MYSMNSYKDLTTEIKISKIRLEGIKEQKDQLLKLMYASMPDELKAMTYSDMPKGGRNDMSLDRIIEQLNRLDSMIFIEENILVNMEDTEKQIGDKLKEFTGLNYKIAYMREVNHRSLQEIADELGYTLGYVKNLSSKVNKKM